VRVQPSAPAGSRSPGHWHHGRHTHNPIQNTIDLPRCCFWFRLRRRRSSAAGAVRVSVDLRGCVMEQQRMWTQLRFEPGLARGKSDGQDGVSRNRRTRHPNPRLWVLEPTLHPRRTGEVRSRLVLKQACSSSSSGWSLLLPEDTCAFV